MGKGPEPDWDAIDAVLARYGVTIGEPDVDDGYEHYPLTGIADLAAAQALERDLLAIDDGVMVQ